jgi:hypothetical protein
LDAEAEKQKPVNKVPESMVSEQLLDMVLHWVYKLAAVERTHWASVG